MATKQQAIASAQQAANREQVDYIAFQSRNHQWLSRPALPRKFALNSYIVQYKNKTEEQK